VPGRKVGETGFGVGVPTEDHRGQSEDHGSAGDGAHQTPRPNARCAGGAPSSASHLRRPTMQREITCGVRGQHLRALPIRVEGDRFEVPERPFVGRQFAIGAQVAKAEATRTD